MVLLRISALFSELFSAVMTQWSLVSTSEVKKTVKTITSSWVAVA